MSDDDVRSQLKKFFSVVNEPMKIMFEKLDILGIFLLKFFKKNSVSFVSIFN